MKQRLKENLNKIKNVIETHSKITLIALFIVGVLIYSFLVSKVTNIAFLGIDEELYISMARTFFYEGVFAKGYEILNYNCVIYSMLISIVYFFYSAKNVLFLMRIIGVILMVSGIFPIYLLSKKVLNSKIKAIGIATLFLILPEMGFSSYVIQEVLLYPVFLWTAYLIYLKFTKEKNKILDLGIILLFVIMFFIKSYTISFAVAYFLTLLITEGKKGIKRTILQGIMFLVIIVIGYFSVYAINNFQTGTNHYSSQISSIFPITIDTIINFIYGVFYYTIFFLFCTGILPILAPIFNIKKYEEKDRKFIIFLITSTVITIVETVLIVFIPEESNKLYPYKFCYRYFALLMIPYLIMFLKLKKEDIKVHKSMLAVYAIVFLYLIWYYIGEGAHTTSIDSPIMFCMQYLYGKWLSIMLIIVAFAISINMLIIDKKNIQNMQFAYIKLMLIGLLFFIHMYWISIMNLSNEKLEGKILQEDFETIIDTVSDKYDKIYLLDGNQENYKYVRTIGGQLKNDYRVISVRRYSKYKRTKNMHNITQRS